MTVTDLFKADVHYGHLSRHWNVAMFKYLYTDLNGTHVIDLVRTKKLLIQACNHIKQATKEGKGFIFVGTKESVGEVVKKQAKKCNASFVVERWVGGTLTNWSRLRHRVSVLKTLLIQEKNVHSIIYLKKAIFSKNVKSENYHVDFAGYSTCNEFQKLLL